MKRFIVTAAVALAIGLGTAATADAQYASQRYTLMPNGGVVITNNYSNWGAMQTNRTYASPTGWVSQRSFYNDMLGNTYGRAAGYNAFRGYGYGYNRGFSYSPLNPYGNWNWNWNGGGNWNGNWNRNSGFFRRW